MSQNYEHLRITPLATPGISDTPLPEEVYPLHQPEVTIGRAPNNDVVLRDLTISRYHARLVHHLDGWVLHNLSPRNWLRVNELSVPNLGFVSVGPQDLIFLGNTLLQIRVYQPESAGKKMDPPPLQSFSRLRALSEWIMMSLLLPKGMGQRTRLLVASIEFLIFLFGSIATLFIVGTISAPSLAGRGLLGLLPALTLPLFPAAGSVVFIKCLAWDAYEPSHFRLVAFLWGAVVAFPLAFFIENISTSLLSLSPATGAFLALQAISVGIIEETTKGLGIFLLFLFLREELNTTADGIIYGALIGAGFALVENFGYFATNAPFLPSLIIGRIILGGFNHSTFTACFGGAFGYIRQTQVRWKQVIAPPLGYMLAVGLHSFFDFVTFLVGILALHSSNDTRTLLLTAAALMGNYFPLFFAQGTLGLAFLKTVQKHGMSRI